MIYSTSGVTSKVFGEATATMDTPLRNPNQYKEAVICEAIAELPESDIKKFVASPEAKALEDNGTLSPEALDRLAAIKDQKQLMIAVCHMAKEAADPLWDEMVACKVQERRIFNDMVAKYGAPARKVVDTTQKDIVETCIPRQFKK